LANIGKEGEQSGHSWLFPPASMPLISMCRAAKPLNFGNRRAFGTVSTQKGNGSDGYNVGAEVMIV
jgi:hypothetical protein